MTKNQLHEKNLCRLTYTGYIVGGLMQFSMATMLVGTIALMIGVMISYYQRSRTQGSALESHYHWLIRTFWIGTGVYLPLLTTIAFALMFPHLDFNGMLEEVSSGAVGDPNQLMAVLIRAVPFWIITFSALLGGSFVLWWLYRCIYGWRKLDQDSAIDNVMRWI